MPDDNGTRGCALVCVFRSFLWNLVNKECPVRMILSASSELMFYLESLYSFSLLDDSHSDENDDV